MVNPSSFYNEIKYLTFSNILTGTGDLPRSSRWGYTVHTYPYLSLQESASNRLHSSPTELASFASYLDLRRRSRPLNKVDRSRVGWPHNTARVYSASGTSRATLRSMLARVDGECDGCGNPQVTKGATRVRVEGKRVAACELCDDVLANEPPEANPNKIWTIVVRLIALKFAKADGTFYIYTAVMGETRDDLPPATKNTFGLKGPLGNYKPGTFVSVAGRFVTDAKYGFQLDAIGPALPVIDGSPEVMKAWLTALPNVGPTRALDLMTKFGSVEAIKSAIKTDPQKLTCVSGLTTARVNEIVEEYKKHERMFAFREYTVSLGLPGFVVNSAWSAWGEEAREIIDEDLFNLCELPSIGFKSVDGVREKLGRPRVSPQRCASGVMHILKLMTDSGHTWMSQEEMSNPPSGFDGRGIREVGLTADEVRVGIDVLQRPRTIKRKGKVVTLPPRVVEQEGRVFLAPIFEAEQGIAQHMHRLLKNTSTRFAKVLNVPSNVFGNLTPAPEQVAAVEVASRSRITVITGGPGTGKTTIVQSLLRMYDKNGMYVTLCAPTGKAARRLSETTGRTASTIHRILPFNEASSSPETIDADVVVADESSMISVELMYRLLSAVQSHARVVFVGDVDQLPSIGPGRVLHDIITKGIVPVVRLTHIHRSATDGDTKRIPQVAASLKEGKLLDLYAKNTNVVFAPFNDVELAQQFVVEAVTRRLPEKYGFAPEDIQVISPQRGQEGQLKYIVGVRGLNKALQTRLNPPTGLKNENVVVGDGEDKADARVGDRVMHIKNNYDLHVMNGEQGVVVRASSIPFTADEVVVTSARTSAEKATKNGGAEKKEPKEVRELASRLIDLQKEQRNHIWEYHAPSVEVDRAISSLRKDLEMARLVARAHAVQGADKPIVLVVRFGDHLVGYTSLETKELNLAYAITVHKAQGSEARAVILIAHEVHSFNTSRPLLYTAFTRAKEYALIVGQEGALRRGLANTKVSQRRTRLQEFLDSTDTPEVKVEHGSIVNDI